MILSAACAKMGPPPGGPEDTEPPRVVSVRPAPDSLGVAAETGIEIVFSEKVRTELAEPLVKLSPPAGSLSFNWQGLKLIVKPEAALRPEMTYRLSVEPGLTDIHRVKSAKRFESYFATGVRFSPGRIEGTVSVRDSLVYGALITATALADTALRFTTESDSNGRYKLPYLPFGKHSLQAFRDINRNGRYDYTREEGADSLADLIFDPLKINFVIALADTTAPYLKSVETPDSLKIVLIFDDPLDSLRGTAGASFELRTPDSLGAEIALDSVRLDSLDRHKVILRPRAPLQAESSYYLKVRAVINVAGLPVQSGRNSRTFRFRPSAAPRAGAAARRR